MPIAIACPGCQRKLNVPDAMIGRRVKCPACAMSFEATPAAPPPSADPFGALESSSSPFESSRAMPERSGKVPGDATAWGRTSTGLNLVLMSVYLSLAVGALFVVFGVFGMLGAFKDMGREGAGLFLYGCGGLITLLLLGSMATFVAGLGFCVNAPSDYGAKVLAILSLVFAGIGLLLGCPSAIIFPLAFGSGFFLFVAQILFLFFLRSCALCLNNKAAAHGVITLLIGLAILFVLICGGAIVGVFAAGIFAQYIRGPEALTASMLLNITMGVVLAVLDLIWIAKYVGTISTLRQAISRYRREA